MTTSTCTTKALLTFPKLQFCHPTRFAVSLRSSSFLSQFSHNRCPDLQDSSFLKLVHKPISSPSIRTVIRASMSSSTADPVQTKPFSVLFVCLGNICRSPAAEGVFRYLVKKKDLDSKFNIDSAGTIDYHEGNPADSRMRAASKRRGVEITSISRPIRPSDFHEFDLILAMDRQNKEDILEAYGRWRFTETFPPDAHKKLRRNWEIDVFTVKLMCSFCKRHDESEVPDPYYGGPQGFEKVLDLLEDACESLLDNILAENARLLG